MKKLLLVVSLFLNAVLLFAQVPNINPAQVKAELDKRGLNQAEVDARLREKGIDINNVNKNNAAQVQQQIEQVLAELEAEKKAGGGAAKKGKIETPKTDKVQKNTVLEKSETEALKERVANEAEVAPKEANLKASADNLAKEKAADITKAVEKGATVEQAISDGLIDAQAPKPKSSVYGIDIFRNKSIRLFSSSDDLKATDSYVIGVGDEFTVSIWGVAEYSGTLQVNKEGYVQPDRMPRIYVKGMTFAKARDLLRSNFSKYYPFRSENFNASVNFKRTISVNLFGEIFNPGSYSISAINTAYNALVAGGGPSDIGSVRNIQLKRAGQKTRIIDVYDYMNNPSVRENFYLEDDDIIFVPIAGRVVDIQGAIKRPMRYELIAGENLMKLVNFAGGLLDNTYQDIIQVKRFENDKQVLIDVNYKNLVNTKSDFNLLPGDVVVFNAIPKAYENFAEISGAVDVPKQYELGNGMKISELVAKAVLQKEARTDIAFLQRQNNDQTVSFQRISLDEILKNPASEANILLQAKDKLIIYTQSVYTDKYKISIDGAVRAGKEYPYDSKQTIKVEDAVLLAGGLRPDATDFAYIMRINTNNTKEKEYIRVNLKNALANPKSADNATLQPADRLFIPSKLTYTDVYNVNIVGAVRTPGEYQYDETLTLKDVLVLAGGMKLEAASNRVEVSRIIIKNNEPTKVTIASLEVDKNMNTINGGSTDFKLQPFDLILVRSVPEFKLQQSITLDGEVRYPGTYTLVAPNEQLSSVIERAGGLSREAFPEGARLFRNDDGTGAVVMNLKQALANPVGSKFNYILKPNDVITIPKAKDLVTVRGAIRAAELYAEDIVAGGKVTVPYHGGKRAMYYVNQYAAGLSKDAKRSRITVLQPSGKINRTVDLGIFKIYPKVTKGSIVSVGYKDPKPVEKTENGEAKKKEEVDWPKIIANGIAQASGIVTLIALLKTISQ
jgi:protein involved in polysaccharide export with SLBB domain